MSRINDLLGGNKIERVRFLLTLSLCILIFIIPSSILDSHQPNLSTADNVFYIPLFFISPVLLFIIFSTTVKRLRDIGENGWWSLLLILPFVNIAFILLLSIMPSSQKVIGQGDRFLRVAILSAIVATTPFVIYFIQRHLGFIPSAEEWYAQGYNHGPWRYSAAGFSLVFPLLATMAIAIFETIKSLSNGRSFKNIGIGALLFLSQVAALCLQAYFLWWTVD